MKNISGLLALSLSLLLWSGCQEQESDDPATPATAPPTLTGFSPTSGEAGTLVVITGTNFSTTVTSNLVKFNGIAATISDATATSLTVSVPTGATTGKITVQVGTQTATSVGDFTMTQPETVPVTITDFTPVSGTEGTSVTITGTNFSESPINNLVKFNGTLAIPTAATPTSLTVIAPTGGSTGKITVQVGSQTATSAEDFVYETPATVTVSTLADSGAFAGIAVDAAGNLYLTDLENHRIRKITPTGTVSTLAGSGVAGFANGNGTAAQFSSPWGIALDDSNTLYIADGANNRIRKITPDGTVSTLAGSGTRGPADGAGTAAQFDFPKGITLDAAGNLYVADDINHLIRKITPTGTVSTLAGDSSTLGSTDGVGTAAQFNRPTSVAVDAANNVYVADSKNDRIRKITPNGTVSTLAGSIAGFADGSGTSARFDGPIGLAVDAAGNVYVADSNNNRIRKVTSDGMVSTVAGGFLGGFADGPGNTAQFRSPLEIAIDASGKIYVLDGRNLRIRVIQ